MSLSDSASSGKSILVNAQKYQLLSSRYKRYFKESSKVLELFSKIPFLNGGLFECLDKPHPTEKTPQGNEKIIRVDGFSDRDDNKLVVPDYLFFGGAADVDLSQAYDDNRQKHIKIRGIIDILNSYNFTVEENTPLDIQVALDPELLGKVFENLLASYNPETKTTARKQTGSFYTPREIVSYMVDESLKEYFTTKLSEEFEYKLRVHDPFSADNHKGTAPELHQLIADKKKLLEENISSLLTYSDEKVKLEPAEINYLIKAVDEIKILDPACGSGAFPMGVLQQLVHLLQKIDPDNRKWKLLQMEKAQKDLQVVMETDDADNFSSVLKEISETFESNSGDYGRKLFLIENCIYGVDIQPIAVQIAKLRFFISLLCEQDPNPERDNLGIKPLPNLETKFVAANTLIGLNSSATLKPNAVYPLEKQLENIRHRHFRARTPETKRKYRELDKELRNKIADVLKGAGFPATSADQVSNWNPYDQNSHALFFDKYWMYGIEEGFSLVIGNPPYVSAPTMVSNYPELRKVIIDSNKYKTLYQKWDLYIPFIEFGLQQLAKNGLLTMIVPYPMTNQNYALKIRELITAKFNLIELVDLNGTKIFENATVSNCIPIISKSLPGKSCIISKISDEGLIEKAFTQNYTDLIQDKTTLVWNLTPEKRETNRHSLMNVLGDYCYISKGMVLNADENTAKGEFVKDDLITESYDKIHCRKYIEAKDIERYNVKKIRYLEYNTKRCPYKLSRPTFRELYERPKLMFNRLGNLMVILDNDTKFLHSDSMFSAVLWKDLESVENKSISASIKRYSNYSRKEMVVLSNDIDLRYLIGILNSRYASNLLSNLRGGDYHIYPEHIRNIPIPHIAVKNQKPFISLVDQIHVAKATDSKVETTMLENEIDKLVYKLYELTYDEVKIIDPDFWLSAEEYDAVKIE